MAAVAFDTLKCARRLKDAGYADQQAEVQAELWPRHLFIIWILW